MIVVGAGMAGLFAACVLRDQASLTVIEKQSGVPNNHSAVLRFRTPAVAEALNIPFKKVEVLKVVVPNNNVLADAISYSLKTNGSARLRSILSADNKVSERWIAPSDLIAQMYDRVKDKCQFGVEADFILRATGTPLISTIPMPVLMKALRYRAPEERMPIFEHRTGQNLIVQLKPEIDIYASAYFPDPTVPWSRISITGNELVAECNDQVDGEGYSILGEVLRAVGLDRSHAVCWELKKQTYSKIQPIDESVRRHFIMWASREHRIFSFGRFATWRPGLLMDDLVNDLRVIQKLIRDPSHAYDHLKKA